VADADCSHLVVELNRAVAVALHEGPAQGLRLIHDLLAREELANYAACSAGGGAAVLFGAAQGVEIKNCSAVEFPFPGRL
jgi:predicted RNA polymerase sigma factor